MPNNSTDLCQPADSFIIAKLMDVWKSEWESKKLELLNNESYTASGKLKNSGKKFFLQLAAKCVRRVNGMRDKNGITFARKAMIRCGLSKNVNGLWEKAHLYPHLQEIMNKYPSEVNGIVTETT